ncbi:MAG: ABC transporter permease [Clostridia bacterium]|nr:ABC transporter permease [Clostridia bacterium]
MTRARTLRRSIAAAPHLVWSVLFIVAPLLFVFYYAFTDKDGAFSFTNIADLFTADYVTIFLRSLSFAVIATFLCLLIGYPLAWCISRMKKHTQGILIMLVMLPLWMNLLIRTYCWMNLLETNGLINTLLGTEWKLLGTSGAVILGMVYNFLPYMVLPICTVMQKLDNSLLEAAADLGCNSLLSVIKVAMPLSLPGVISGVTMVFVPSISTFYISQKMGGGSFDLIGDTIERQFMANTNYNMGAALSLVLMVLVLLSMAVMNRFGDEEGGIVV